MRPAVPESSPAAVPAPAGRFPRALIGLGAVAAAGAAALLFLFRPAGQFFYPRCSFHELTGWLCPGCGGLRATHELLHGQILAAARCNALLVLGVPAVATVWLAGRLRGRPFQLLPRTLWLMFAVSLVFTVVRNLPLGVSAWLVP